MGEHRLGEVEKCEARIVALRQKRPKGQPGIRHATANSQDEIKSIRREFNSIVRGLVYALPNFNPRMDPQSYGIDDYPNSAIFQDLAASLHRFLFLGINSIQVYRQSDSKMLKSVYVPTVSGKLHMITHIEG